MKKIFNYFYAIVNPSIRGVWSSSRARRGGGTKNQSYTTSEARLYDISVPASLIFSDFNQLSWSSPPNSIKSPVGINLTRKWKRFILVLTLLENNHKSFYVTFLGSKRQWIVNYKLWKGLASWTSNNKQVKKNWRGPLLQSQI